MSLFFVHIDLLLQIFAFYWLTECFWVYSQVIELYIHIWDRYLWINEREKSLTLERKNVVIYLTHVTYLLHSLFNLFTIFFRCVFFCFAFTQKTVKNQRKIIKVCVCTSEKCVYLRNLTRWNLLGKIRQRFVWLDTEMSG